MKRGLVSRQRHYLQRALFEFDTTGVLGLESLLLILSSTLGSCQMDCPTEDEDEDLGSRRGGREIMNASATTNDYWRINGVSPNVNAGLGQH